MEERQKKKKKNKKTPSVDLQRRIQVMDMRCFRKILRFSYRDHVTNEEVRNKMGTWWLNW